MPAETLTDMNFNYFSQIRFFYYLSQITQISQIFAASSISDISVISCVPLVASEQNSSAVEPKSLQRRDKSV